MCMEMYKKHKAIMDALSFFVFELQYKRMLSQDVAKQFLESMDNALTALEKEVRLEQLEEINGNA